MTDTKFYLNDNSASVSAVNLAPQVDDVNSDLKPNGSTKAQVDLMENASIGVLPDSVYDSSLVWWRSAMRRWIMLSLKKESAWIARVQTYRRPLLDTYFLYTSMLGTHTFFMLLLPACYFFGYDRIGRTLMALLGLGVYWSSFFKDLVCSPRPYAPPVSRLTMGTHHLEYGFPSTHSTNTISMTLYLHVLLYRFYTTGALFPSVLSGEGDEITPGLSPLAFHALQLVLVWYASTIVFGRIYCGMHSITDCVAGSLLGAGIWAAHWLVEERIDTWARAGGLEVPLIFSLLSLLLINYHPQPVDDCPCFEDAVACIAAILGMMSGLWHGWWSGLFHETSIGEGTFKKIPISQLSNPVVLLVASTRVVVGVASIFALRLILKSTLHLILPPLYRILSKLVSLPNRRFYTPATEYKHVPLRRGWERLGPSVVDLGELGVGTGAGGGEVVSVTGRGQRDVEGGGLKNRNPYFNALEYAKERHFAAGPNLLKENDTARSYPNGTALVVGHEYEFDDNSDDESSVMGTEKETGATTVSEKTSVFSPPSLGRSSRKRYDAEVLTKIVVYVSIGLLASEFAPVLFEIVGL